MYQLTGDTFHRQISFFLPFSKPGHNNQAAGLFFREMNQAALIFPHQLFREPPILGPGRTVYLVEEKLFFSQYNFHKQKILFHRASMKNYEHYLQEKGHTVQYVEAHEKAADIRILIRQLGKEKLAAIHIVDPTDNWLEERIRSGCKESGLKLEIEPNPCFLNQLPELESFFKNKSRYFQTEFYTWQRKKRNLLIDINGAPTGGQWSFDADNRKKIPKNHSLPTAQFPTGNQFVEEARNYVNSQFGKNYGTLNNPFCGNDSFYPINHEETRQWLTQFLETRFASFGDFEDAMIPDEHLLYHSLLTPMLNAGLMLPGEILDITIQHARKHKIPINSLEGFLRQILGWREFIRIVYEQKGSFQRTRNFWNFSRKIPEMFWTGETGILPVDTVIKKVLGTGYCHHIERLMVLGNFMLLCEFDPDEVYRWFMEMFIDAYDWVMVPNVYGMTQFADGGLMTTKPYISGSNYLMKMGSWQKGDWQETWDGLFWRFMDKHRSFFQSNPRLGMLVNRFDQMDKVKQLQHLLNAESFLRKLD